MLQNLRMNGVIKVKVCSLAMPGKAGIAVNVARGVILGSSLSVTWLYEKINKTMGYDWAH